MHNDGMTKLEKLTWLEDLLKELTHEACESHYKEIRMGIRMVQSLKKTLEPMPLPPVNWPVFTPEAGDDLK